MVYVEEIIQVSDAVMLVQLSTDRRLVAWRGAGRPAKRGGGWSRH